MQKIFPFSGLPGDVADEEDGDDDHKDDGEVRLPPQELARADVVVPAVQYSTVQYSAVQYRTVQYSHYWREVVLFLVSPGLPLLQHSSAATVSSSTVT